MGKLSNSVLKSAAERIVPCDDGIKTFCANDTDYPAESINALLVPHLKQEYFKEVFTGPTEKACQRRNETTITINALIKGIFHTIFSKHF